MPDKKAKITKPASPCSMVIFGAAGDLTKRLVMPALYNLALAKLLPDNFALVGVDLAGITAEEWEQTLSGMLQEFVKGGGANGEVDQNTWTWLTSRMSYVQGDLNDLSLYEKLDSHLNQLASERQASNNYLFYLAISDRFFGSVIEHLGQSKLGCETGGNWRRVVVEKPFGHDLESARALNARILSVLKETQIYRIDHFLGKETVQNIVMFRFANGLFEPLWNRDRIDHIQITAAETVGVEKRGKFYEVTGALRDMVPNHVFQLLAMTCMEAPNSFGADAVRTEKAKVISAIRTLTPEEVALNVVRGQYGPGDVNGTPVKGYREEENVAPDSPMETYAALKLAIDNWRWFGVPIYLRTGKRLKRRKTTIAIRFKETPFAQFRDSPVQSPAPNWLVLRIQPDEGISLEFGAKVPGPTVTLGDVQMDFKYKDYFGAAPNTGYETLIYDVMIGDQTLFQRADNIEAGWCAVQPVLDAWASKPPAGFPSYNAGVDGPACADELLARDGRAWRPMQ